MARTSTPTKTTETPKRAPRKAAAVAKEPVKKAAPHKPVLTEDQRLDSLEQRVEVLESERPGRKPMPLLAIRQRGVCAVEPDSDSSGLPLRQHLPVPVGLSRESLPSEAARGLRAAQGEQPGYHRHHQAGGEEDLGQEACGGAHQAALQATGQGRVQAGGEEDRRLAMDPVAGTGPPPIPAGQGKKHLQRIEPFYQVNLDAAAFDWLWRLVEARHGQHVTQIQGNGDDVHGLQAEVSKRAVISFREAAGTLTVGTPPAKKRRLVTKPNL